MRKIHLVIIALAVIVAAEAAGSGMTAPMPQRNPKDEAVQSLNDGLKYRDRAWAAEKELATTTDAARKAKLEEIISKSYGADLKAQKRAIQLDPNLFQAHTELGYAFRKTGDYTSSIAEYDRALELMPNYAEALEYRGEAFLGLNRVDDAKGAYLALYDGGDHERAQMLAGAMQRWLAARKAAPGDGAASVGDFEKWLSQRTEITKTTGTAGSGGTWR